MTLTSLDAVKTWMSIDDTSNDVLLTAFIDTADNMICNYLGREIEQNSYTETYDGVLQQRIFPRNGPIASVSSLQIYGHDIPAAATGLPGYVFDAKSIYLRGYVFERGIGNIEVTYEGGYDPVPPAVAQAANIVVQGLFEAMSVDPNAASENVPGAFSVTYRTPPGSMPMAAILLLQPYRQLFV